MKKNLLTILILALLVVNLAMTSIMLLSVQSTNNKTAKLVSDIAAAIKLEDNGGSGVGKDPLKRVVSVKDTESVVLTKEANIVPLMVQEVSDGGDGEQHYLQLSVTLYLDKKDEGYSEYASTVSETYSDRILSKIKEIVGQYNYGNVMASRAEIKAACLKAIWELYDGSSFIFDLDFPTYNPA